MFCGGIIKLHDIRVKRIFELRIRQTYEKAARSERILHVFEDCGSTEYGAIRYQRGQKTFAPNIMTLNRRNGGIYH